jgi:class 3 adenylate cyclase
VHWTNIYVFFSDRVPGLTASLAFRDRRGTVRGVFGVDVRLDTLSALLARLDIGEGGRAMIIDGAGQLVAFPEVARTVREGDGTLAPVRIDELGDPVLTRAFDVFRIEGPGRGRIRVEGRSWLTIAAPLPGVTGRDWSVLIVVPEESYVGFVGRNTRIALAAAAVIALLALLLAGSLVRQGLRADRTARRLQAQGRALAAQADGFAALVEAGRPEEAGSRPLLETVARTLGARRVSLWRLGTGGRSLRCEDGFDVLARADVTGTRLDGTEMPEAFAALLAGPLDLAGAAADPRLAALAKAYLEPAGTRALLSVPIRRGEETVGLLWVEDRDAEVEGAEGFARAAVAFLASRFAPRAAAARPLAEPVRLAVGAAAAPPAARRLPGDGLLGAARTRVFLNRLAERRPGERGLAAELFRDVTVLVVRFADPVALAEAAPGEGSAPLADRAMRLLEQVAAAHGIAYLRVLGEAALAADGFDGGRERASAMAAAALALQDGLAGLFHAAEQRPAFRIGLDTGTVIGSAVGDSAPTYNVWGEAVQGATAMAETAPEAGIHVTETMRALLGEAFLLRPRGRFWLEGTGEMATFLLTGQT